MQPGAKDAKLAERNHASKQTRAHVGHTFSVYKGLSLSLVAAGAPRAKEHHHVC